ncbi:hypothetical protein I4U23_018076 [Adineta vaga]|nr:hypothetical protein I4U23_018076 [Adineta vaga]
MYVPSLSTIPKLSYHLETKQLFNLPVPIVSKKEIKTQDKTKECFKIVNDLSTVLKRSEELLAPVKQPQTTENIGGNTQIQSIKPSNFYDSTSDRSSERSASVFTVSRRTSIRPLHGLEKYSGIKCALPSYKSTILNMFKGLEKHNTSIKYQQSKTSTAITNYQTVSNDMNKNKDKSPWRLRFEKFLNHEELAPLTATKEIAASTKTICTEKKSNNILPPSSKKSKQVQYTVTAGTHTKVK